ncbi:MAG TPA: YCF48-related protein [Methylibium sp.]|nr:YCF48-related protein [Methylibium sp.]
MPTSLLRAALPSGLALLIIGALLYAGLFIKPQAAGAAVAPSVFTRNDRFYGVTVPAPKQVWLAGTAGRVLLSRDDGLSWERQATPTADGLQDIAAWTADKAVAVGNNAAIVYTTDGGRKWLNAVAPRNAVANKLLRVRVDGGESAWAVGEGGSVLVSRDGGATWVGVGKGEDVAWNDVLTFGAHVLIAGEFGQLRRSGDAGKSWQSVRSGAQTSLMGLARDDAGQILAVGVNGTVIASGDDGVTWQARPSPTREHLFAVTWQSGVWTVVGDKGVLLRSRDSGASWSAPSFQNKTLAWQTSVVDTGAKVYVAGAESALLDESKRRVFGR